MPLNRVVVTGTGVISSIGCTTEEFWQSLCNAKHGFGPIVGMEDVGLRFSHAAQAHTFEPSSYFSEKQIDGLDRSVQMAVAAARQALAHAGLDPRAIDTSRFAVITGTAIGGQESQDKLALQLYRNNSKRAHPLSVPRIMTNAATSHISMDLGLRGPAYTTVSACSSSNNAIGQAYWLLRSGTAERAITGGTDATLSYIHLKAWEAMRVVAPDLCRPFSAERKGMILGEGAAMLVLETLECAQQRNAKILAEIVGYGSSADAVHLTSPDVNGAARAIEAALADAGLAENKQAVAYINAHGTGTQANDAMETRAIRQVFGDHADHLAVSSTKSMHGHALGASGALEAVATVLALKNGILPPTANYTTPDPACDLDVIPNQARDQVVDYAVSNAFAFGGLNAVLVFRRWSEGDVPNP